jgi:hypothetical protein
MSRQLIKRLIISTAIFLAVFLFSSQISEATSGCCSWHKGVSHCDQCTGRQVCNDGTFSPSCTCARDTSKCPVYCGDYKCNGNENCSSCPKDCGACPKSDEEKIIEKINSAKNDYQHNYLNFRENLIQDLMSSYGNSTGLNRIGYFVYTMLPDIK